MAPKKKPQRPTKKARAEGASSSRSQGPRGLTAEEIKRFRALAIKKEIKPNVFLNWDVIRDYGLTRQFERLLADPAWANLLSIKEKIYREVTLEFMASFEIKKPDRLFRLNNEVSFCAFGKRHSMSMTKFCEYTGLYSPDYIQTDEFKALPTEWPIRELSYEQFWSSIARKGSYDPSLSRGSHLKKNSYRILHSLLVHSLTGKMYSIGVVSQLDLYPMWSMIRGQRVNVAVELAFAIRHQGQIKKKGLFCGAYITRILKNMQEFPDQAPDDEVTESYPMSDIALKQWDIPKLEEGNDSSQEDEVKDETTRSLQKLTQEVKKLKKKNKSLKRYIGSIAEAFAKKLKVKLPDCVSSSSSSSDEEGAKSGEGSGAPAEEEDDDIEREIDAYQSGEGMEISPEADDEDESEDEDDNEDE